ncbi:membrane metallo-endopeptidase-like 1 [Haemaphysalis longicornis]
MRLSAAELRDPRSPVWPALQAARLGARVSRCVLRLLLPQSPTERRSRASSRRGLAALLACLHGQHVRARTAGHPWRPGRDARALADLGAVGVAKDAFDAYAARLAGGKDPEINSTGAGKSLRWNQVFYIAYTHSMCDNPGKLRRRLFRPASHWERVNGPLSNDRGFQRAFQCRRGDPMHHKTACSFWD